MSWKEEAERDLSHEIDIYVRNHNSHFEQERREDRAVCLYTPDGDDMFCALTSLVSGCASGFFEKKHYDQDHPFPYCLFEALQSNKVKRRIVAKGFDLAVIEMLRCLNKNTFVNWD